MAKLRKKPVKKYTLSEFKAWLEGIEEIQPDDWCPNVDQWQMIRTKIAAIIEPPPVPVRTVPEVPRHVVPARSGQIPFNQLPTMTSNLPPSSLTESSLEMTPAAKALLNGGKLPTDGNSAILPGTPTSGTPIPNSPTGKYESSFT